VTNTSKEVQLAKKKKKNTSKEVDNLIWSMTSSIFFLLFVSVFIYVFSYLY
jgi:heme/copper-type cytochrome/quinol oxidase subunit 2